MPNMVLKAATDYQCLVRTSKNAVEGRTRSQEIPATAKCMEKVEILLETFELLTARKIINRTIYFCNRSVVE
jgi:hypothetical protein